MLIGDIIKDYRKEKGLSQRDFAKKCNLSHTYISALEKKYDIRTGKPIAPTLDVVKKISDALNIPLQDLLNILDNSQEFVINTSEEYIKLDGLTEEDKEMIKKQVEYLRKKNNQ